MKPIEMPAWKQTDSSTLNSSPSNDTAALFSHLGCVIMASGEGKRFGSNKLMASLGDIPLIGWIISTVDALFEQKIVVTRRKSVADYCNSLQVPVILHEEPYRSDTVRIGVCLLSDTEGCFFCQGDQPLISESTFLAMARAFREDPHSIFRPQWEDTPGAPILFPAEFYPQLAALPEGKGGGYLLRKYPERVHSIPIADPFELMDVDTTEDLEQLKEHLFSPIHSSDPGETH